MKKLFASISILVALALVLAGSPCAAEPGAGNDGTFRVLTGDGVSLALVRYRPAESASFRDGGQPVILMSATGTNCNEFDIRTPPGERYGLTLPEPLPDWADGDRCIRDDPMKLYSLAYFLYDQGFDVWLSNYRGQGRQPNRSDQRLDASIDDLAVYDMPAIVGFVSSQTGRKPVWIGHSLGAMMAYMYLQGASYGSGPDPHVVSDPTKTAERNNGNGSEALLGLVSLDGPSNLAPSRRGTPRAAWRVLAGDGYIDVRLIARALGERAILPLLLFKKVVWAMDPLLPDPIEQSLKRIFPCVNPSNIEPDVGRYLAEYSVDGFHYGITSQLLDSAVIGGLREHFRNGPGNSEVVVPPPRREADGYYCYTDNLSKLSLPALLLADATTDTTSPEDVRRVCEGKTPNELDAFRVVEGTAHVDLVCGLDAPRETFPVIGEWLRGLDGGESGHGPGE
ncbi:MAG: alpha/beta fold hydrolase [Actinobacteria bacterium]|nr:alpha/beta fold hydrolase [Actinomycetota bacterium]MBU1945057.1 alpha/beta fold hydrolase [Actinomycetota bacterium]MBU2686607.1 alpha/beta fold hydrolase [Actinomycetota bacterium]